MKNFKWCLIHILSISIVTQSVALAGGDAQTSDPSEPLNTPLAAETGMTIDLQINNGQLDLAIDGTNQVRVRISSRDQHYTLSLSQAGQPITETDITPEMNQMQQVQKDPTLPLQAKADATSHGIDRIEQKVENSFESQPNDRRLKILGKLFDLTTGGVSTLAHFLIFNIPSFAGALCLANLVIGMNLPSDVGFIQHLGHEISLEKWTELTWIAGTALQACLIRASGKLKNENDRAKGRHFDYRKILNVNIIFVLMKSPEYFRKFIVYVETKIKGLKPSVGNRCADMFLSGGGQ